MADHKAFSMIKMFDFKVSCWVIGVRNDRI